MTTEERLDKLEEELTAAKRRYRRLLIVIVLTVGAFALAWTFRETAGTVQAQGAGAVPKIISANEFVLKDTDGKARAMLTMLKDGPALCLYDESINPGAVLTVTKGGPALRLFDKKGVARAALAARKEGPALFLADENGTLRAALVASKDGPALSLADANGKNRAMLGADSITMPDGKTIIRPESSLMLSGPDGKVTWHAQ